MMNNDLISRKKLVAALLEIRHKHPPTVDGVQLKYNMAIRAGMRKALREVEMAPAVDAAPVVHGRWVNQDSTYTRYQCSACKARNYGGHEKFCPNCGAKMDKEEE